MKLIREEDTLFAEHVFLHIGTAEGESRSEGSVFEDNAVARHATGHARARMHGETHETRLPRGTHETRNLPV